MSDSFIKTPLEHSDNFAFQNEFKMTKITDSTQDDYLDDEKSRANTHSQKTSNSTEDLSGLERMPSFIVRKNSNVEIAMEDLMEEDEY
jgi:hypothetical protein